MARHKEPTRLNSIHKLSGAERIGKIKKATLLERIIKYKQLLIMLIPGMLILIIFSYIPMVGVMIAFKDYTFVNGIFGSKWVGMKYFEQVFNDPYFYITLKNTLIISAYKLFFNFITPIIFALLLNEISNQRLKRVIQTATYLPYFVSWVVISGIIMSLLSMSGPINTIAGLFNIPPQSFLSQPKLFRSILVVTEVWKGFGYGAIIYLATIAGISPELYEAATIDGAQRFNKIIHITIPSIVPTICIMLILSCANILNAGFDQIFNLYNSAVMDVADIIDTYVYRLGIEQMKYSYSAAIGLFKSVVALILIVSCNTLVRKMGGGEYSLW